MTDLLNVLQVEDLLDLENIQRSMPPSDTNLRVLTNVGEQVPMPAAGTDDLPANPPPVVEPQQPQLQPPPVPPAP